MKPVGWMAGTSVAIWLAVGLFVDTRAAIEVLAGMLGPLVMAIGSWMLMERTYRRHPESLTSLMVTGFAGKMLFFGVYVVVMLRGLSLRPVPFIVSFTGYFIALHFMEALSLRGLFTEPTRVSR